MNPTPTLSCTGLTAGYGTTAVIGPVAMKLDPGEILAVVGGNGAGKSTLLRTLVGQQQPLSGSVSVLGRPLDERTASFRAAVSQVFDDDAFFPSLTAAEHLLVLAAGHAVRDPADAVAATLEEFGIGQEADSFPYALSSGQRRRLLLASAFVRPHSLLVLDEPEQRLDAAMRVRLADILVADAQDGGATVMACHDPLLIRSCASTALILDDGQALAAGPEDAARHLEEL